MKNTIITITALCCFGLANAQDLTSKKGENYLPEAGEWAIGFNADGIFRYLGNSFNGNLNNDRPNLTFMNEGTFVGKKFITDKSAYRVLVNFRYENTSQTLPSEDIAPDEELEMIDFNRKSFNLALGVGKEWRRGKTRLQGFYGADGLVTLSSSSILAEAADGPESFELKSGLTVGASVRGFLGAEYFIFPKIAIGAQYTWGVNVTFGGKTTYSENGIETIAADEGSSVLIGGVGISSINLTLYF